MFIAIIITIEIWIWISGRMLHPGGFSEQVIFYPENLYLSYPDVPESTFLFFKNFVYVYNLFYWYIYFSVVLWFGG